jgi:hypothetical protein
LSTEGPSKRWGHSSVEALDCMFIIGGYDGKNIYFKLFLNLPKLINLGQYLGDIWIFDFKNLEYLSPRIEAANPKRS